MPFLHDLDGAGRETFAPRPTTISGNLIFANYGSSQGVDNDDGSSPVKMCGFYAGDQHLFVCVDVWRAISTYDPLCIDAGTTRPMTTCSSTGRRA